MPSTSVYSSMLIPTLSSALRASAAMAFMSKVSRFFPKMRLIRLGCVISRLSLIFSVTVKPGKSMNSWCTMPMPFTMASCGEVTFAGSPSKSTWPSKPPVV